MLKLVGVKQKGVKLIDASRRAVRVGAEKAGSTEEEQEWQVPRVECTSGWNGQQAREENVENA